MCVTPPLAKMVKRVAVRDAARNAKRVAARTALKVKPRVDHIQMMQVMKKFKVPSAVMCLAFMIMSKVECEPDLDWTEQFAGMKSVTNAMLSAGRVAVPFEMCDEGIVQNIIHCIGFVYCMTLTLKVRIGGGTNTAPVCSTWTWMNRFTSQRTTFRPLGAVHLKSVSSANEMVSRVIMTLWILSARRVFWVLEQPVHSLMEFHPRFAELAKRMTITRATVRMSMFGAATAKPTWLYSNYAWISEIKNHVTPSMRYTGPLTTTVVYYVDAHGKRCVQGGDGLKKSQAYPKGFGKALNQLYEAHRGEIEREGLLALIAAKDEKITADDVAISKLRGQARWKDANLDDVWSYLLNGEA
jgi:hypothetical protein